MKLFGSRGGGARVSGRKKVTGVRKRMTGAQKGLLLMLLALLILAGTVFGIYKAFVKPPEKKQPPAETTETEKVNENGGRIVVSETGEEIQQPTVKDIKTEYDPNTGDVIEVEVEIPASVRDGIYNILICGTDDDGWRTDTIIVAHLDVNTHETALLSIPRDSVVPNPQGGIMKINDVYQGGKEKGMEKLAKRLSYMLGFQMDGFVLVDLDAFEAVVDLVGGVDFDVPMDMYYTDPTQDLYINLKKGMQHLDGDKAEQLVRYRKGYDGQDITRTHVQQDFLRALAKQCLVTASISKVQEYADLFATYVLTDLSVGNMVYFGQELLKCDFDEMQTYTVGGKAVMINGLSYYPLYLGSVLKIVNESFNPYDTDITENNVSVIYPELALTYQEPAPEVKPISTVTTDPSEETEPDGETETGDPESGEPEPGEPETGEPESGEPESGEPAPEPEQQPEPETSADPGPAPEPETPPEPSGEAQ